MGEGESAGDLRAVLGYGTPLEEAHAAALVIPGQHEAVAPALTARAGVIARRAGRVLAAIGTLSPQIALIAAATATTLQAPPLTANCPSRRRTIINVTSAARAQMQAPIARVAEVQT